MAITPNTTFSSGAVLTADQMNRLPWGVMGRAEATANQSGITTVVDVTGLSVTFTADSTRIYRTTVYLPVIQQNTSAGYDVITITNASSTTLMEGVIYQALNGESPFVLIYTESGITGSTTRKARAYTSAGSILLSGSSTRRMSIVVEDIGKA